MTPITCARRSPPRAQLPSFPTIRPARSNIRSTSIFMPNAISWSAASQSSSSSGASQHASKKQLGIIRPSSRLPPSSYGCDKCPQDLVYILLEPAFLFEFPDKADGLLGRPCAELRDDINQRALDILRHP